MNAYRILNRSFVFLSILLCLIIILGNSTVVFGSSSAPPGGCGNDKDQNAQIEAAVANYLNEFGINAYAYEFACSTSNNAFPKHVVPKQIVANYRASNNEIDQTIILTSVQLGIEDVAIDINDGKFFVAGLMYSDVDAWNQIFSSISLIISGVTGIGVLACLMAFIIQIIKLGAAAGNPSERERAVNGLLWTGIGTAGLGAVTVIFSFAYSFI